ncbi:MAG: hypothetical protein R8L58_08120 [Mariprofundaceae bacterium]
MAVAERLGLHNSGNPTAGDYVGLVWWPGHEGKTALCVNPKFKQMDYLQMYLECLQHPDVAPHMDKCFFFWPEKPLIEIKQSEIPLKQAAAPFAALAFVRELHDMVRRNMRKNFIQQEENLTGRFKGRLLMSQHVRKNLLNARPDRNYCQFGVISEDCRENQVLLAALDRCGRKLSQHGTTGKDANILRMIRVCRAALQGVTLRRHIHNRDFAGIRYTGTFIHYKRPHALAKMILNSQELDPRTKAEGNGDDLVKVVPFALCTSELFERYTELKLRKALGDNAGQLYPERDIANDLELKDDSERWRGLNGKIGNDRGEMRVKPDFLVPADDKRTAWILDSKYKQYRRGDPAPKINHKDFRQIALYASHEGVLEKLGCIRDYNLVSTVKIRGILVYPDNDCKKKLFDEQIQNEPEPLFGLSSFGLRYPTGA